ncbi:MAG: hypothetical protein O7E57_11590 [Gammaproteobacteria bacterium]|nr:hypothetical protein [Gammaproteobacteria bacterium]
MTQAKEPVSTSSFEPKRTTWGVPDIDGVWDFRSRTPLERPPEFAGKAVFTPEEARAFIDRILTLSDNDTRVEDKKLDVEGAYNDFWLDQGTEINENLRTSLIIDPPDGRLPEITPGALARKAEQNRLRTPPVRDLFSFSADATQYRPSDPESLGLSERCLVGFNAGPPITPSGYNNNLRIIQTPDYVVLVTEMIHTARIVPIDEQPRPPSNLARWSGSSHGRWEGDTLVVETVNFTDKTPSFQLPVLVVNPLDAGAVGSGINMHLIERFTLTREGRLEYEYTLTDPYTFVQPFTVQNTMRATDDRIYEYACHEGNYAMRGMLKGARLLESEEAAVD